MAKAIKDKPTKLYEITADYRPNNKFKPKYYVCAESSKKAKQIFTADIPWLGVYGCKEIKDDNAVMEIISNRRHYIVLGSRFMLFKQFEKSNVNRSETPNSSEGE